MFIGLPRGETYYVSRWIFLRCLAVIYLIAFASLGVQITGLVGERGILPAGPFLEAVHERFGTDSYRLLPTLCWFGAGNAFLHGICRAGFLLSIVLFFGRASVPALSALWILYLSLLSVGQDFLSFQWDTLLLETGFLAIFSAPLSWHAHRDRFSPPSRVVIGLFRWLLFRLIFLAGYVKLASGDEAWRNFTALLFHYETQPIPSWTSWYAHHGPVWFQKASVAVVFVIECVMPFLIFAGRKPRAVACGAIVFLQVLIMATGNYGFFNLLTIALSLMLLDDDCWPKRLREFIDPDPRINEPRRTRVWPRWIMVPLAAALLYVSTYQMFERSGYRLPEWPPFRAFRSWVRPFHVTSSYGLFAVMTTRRPEITIEGSPDGREWRVYEFRYKPGKLDRAPPFVAPHMPRLDWQMWFAALRSYAGSPWFERFLERLLEGAPDVLRLLEVNPFPDKPPAFVRAKVSDYNFSDPLDLRARGLWWQRGEPRPFSPVLALKEEESMA